MVFSSLFLFLNLSVSIFLLLSFVITLVWLYMYILNGSVKIYTQLCTKKPGSEYSNRHHKRKPKTPTSHKRLLLPFSAHTGSSKDGEEFNNHKLATKAKEKREEVAHSHR